MNDWQLECYLGFDDIGVARLALCPRPHPGDEAADIATLASIAGCSEAQLGRLFTENPRSAQTHAQASAQRHAHSGSTRMKPCRSKVGAWSCAHSGSVAEYHHPHQAG